METVVDTSEGSEGPPPTLPQDEPLSVEQATAEVSTPSPPQNAPSHKDRGGEEVEDIKVRMQEEIVLLVGLVPVTFSGAVCGYTHIFILIMSVWLQYQLHVCNVKGQGGIDQDIAGSGSLAAVYPFCPCFFASTVLVPNLSLH